MIMNNLNNIKQSLLKIEPGESARERMFTRITDSAVDEIPQKRRVNLVTMNFAAIAAALLLIVGGGVLGVYMMNRGEFSELPPVDIQTATTVDSAVATFAPPVTDTVDSVVATFAPPVTTKQLANTAPEVTLTPPDSVSEPPVTAAPISTASPPDFTAAVTTATSPRNTIAPWVVYNCGPWCKLDCINGGVCEPPATTGGNNNKPLCVKYEEHYTKLMAYVEEDWVISGSVISARIIDSWVSRVHADGVTMLPDGTYVGVSIYFLYYTVEVLEVYEGNFGFNVGDIIEVDSSIVKTDGSSTLPDDENPELTNGNEYTMFLATVWANALRPQGYGSVQHIHQLNNFCEVGKCICDSTQSTETPQTAFGGCTAFAAP
jgi:hypothetical protein